ncbi:MAG: hypothetical protein QM496_22410, partial [Verrucomicrobiota bacterium]
YVFFMVLSLVHCLCLAAPDRRLGDCVKHVALFQATGIAHEKLNNDDTCLFNTNVRLINFHQP